MFEQVKFNMYYLIKSSWSTILIFWGIYLGFITLLFLLTLSFQSSSIEFIAFNIIPSIIFTAIFATMFFKDTFPSIIKYGTSRLSYLLAILIYGILYAAIMSIISNLLVILIERLIDLLNINNFQFYGLGTSFGELASLSEIMVYEGLLYLLSFLLWFIISSLFFRFGYKISSIFIIVIAIPFFVKSLAAEMIDLLSYLVISTEKYNAFAFLFPISVLMIGIWLLTRNASIVDRLSNK